jgi:hypothetical protein
MKQSYAFLMFVLLMLLTIPASAQAEKPFRIGAGLGCSFTGYRDEVESPINRYLNALTYIIDGNIEKGDFFHSFNINFFTGNPRMKAPYKGYSHKEYVSYRGIVEYALDYRLWGNQIFPGYLGGAFRTLFYYTGDDSNDVLGRAFPTGVILFSLDLHASQKWIIDKKNTLVFSIGYPIFGYAIRPAYAGFDELWLDYLYENQLKIITLGKITSFHNYWAVLGDLKYQHQFNSWFSVYSCLGFELSRINFPRPRKDALFRLNGGVAFTF